jgi:site-specific DNA-methyltransferase (adenine-specific)
VTPYYADDAVTIYHGDCREVMRWMMDGEEFPMLVDAVVTSPPYAEQRAAQYGGIPEAEYPEWCVEWMRLTPLFNDASVLLNIRAHLRDGFVSPYVLKTRLALLDAGWGECEELIWYKTGGGTGPFGSRHRPRRAWESILWFARTGSPWVNVKATGTPTLRTIQGIYNGSKGTGDYISGLYALKAGDPTRCEDVVQQPTGRHTTDGSEEHPAPMPLGLAKWMIQLVVAGDGLVLDPFMGSGTTLRAAKDLGRRAIGIEIEERYCEIAAKRMAQEVLAL